VTLPVAVVAVVLAVLALVAAEERRIQTSTRNQEFGTTSAMSPEETIANLLAGMTRFQASDLHLKVGYPPYYRVAGHLRKLKEVEPFVSSEFIEQMMNTVIPAQRRHAFDTHGALDFSAKGPTGERYRINIYRSCAEMHAAIRRVQSDIPSFEDCNFHPPTSGCGRGDGRARPGQRCHGQR